MQNGFFHTAHPTTKLFLVLFLMFTSYLILFGIGMLVAISVFNVSVSEVISIIETNDFEGNIPLIRLMQVLYSTGLFLVPALLAAFLIEKRAKNYLFANRIPGAEIILLMILLMFAIVPIINYIGFLNENLVLPERWSGLMDRIKESDEDQWGMMEAFLNTGSIAGLLFNLFMIALIPALGEELLFRGVLQRILGEWFRNQHIAIWVVAILFSLAHYQFSAFIPRILLGALFGYLFIWTRSIWIPVIAHFVNNGMGVVYYHFYYRGDVAVDPDSIGVEENVLIFMLASVLVTALILIMIRRLGRKSADAQFPGIE